MNNRTLGTIAMICAPAMLIEVPIADPSAAPVIVGTVSMIFMFGSLCSHIGLWRVAATGRKWWGRAPLAIQIVLVSLAFLFGLFEATGLLAETNPLFIITDMSWPLSMIFMIVVGIATVIANRLQGWRRFVPLLCGLAFPSSILIMMASGLEMQSQGIAFVFFGMLAAFWMLLGFVVRQSESEAQASAVPARGLA